MKFTHPPGATPVDGFTIRRGIHRGGFGEVYYAVSDAGKEVALKLLQHEPDVELRGVTQCLNLKHPNLVNLFDVKTDSHGESWVVMEYVNGTSLEDVLAAFPNGLSLDEVRDWLTGLVAGVSHLHDRGIVHRDLKPANVYRENGVVKVGDVGLSKKLGSDRRGAHTQSVGTVYYMAPEVAKGQYGPEVDVYSLGIMLYELLTGRVPFTGETTAEILMKHLTAKPDLAPLPERLRAVVARALEKDPQKRTSTVRQLEEEFAQAIDDNRQSASTRPPSPQSGRPWMGGDRPEARNGRPTSFASATLAYAASVPAVPVSPAPPPPVPARSGNPSTRDARESVPTGKARSARASSTNVSDRHRWIALVIALVGGLIVFSPGTPRAWAGLGLIGLAYSAALFARTPKWGPDELEPLAEPVTPLRQALAE
ncbi:MAG: serine/threonine protein kinase, partial [Candidatus Saccharimonas sp.]|nr:serine/threonine protein kinase [Planctomycetaceae bacterium]